MGELPVTFLKALLKVDLELKPASWASAKKVSFCATAKKHDGMTPEREHYDQFMGRVVEKGMPVVDALKLVPEQFKTAVKAQALDFMKRYNRAWRENPTGIKGR